MGNSTGKLLTSGSLHNLQGKCVKLAYYRPWYSIGSDEDLIEHEGKVILSTPQGDFCNYICNKNPIMKNYKPSEAEHVFTIKSVSLITKINGIPKHQYIFSSESGNIYSINTSLYKCM